MSNNRPKIPTWFEYWIALPLLVYGGTMFALFALLSFVVAFAVKLLGASTGDFDLVILGFCFVALHLTYPVAVPGRSK